MAESTKVESKLTQALNVLGTTLQPGENVMGASRWAQLKEQPAVKKLLESGELVEGKTFGEKEEPKAEEPKKEEPKKEEPTEEPPSDDAA